MKITAAVARAPGSPLSIERLELDDVLPDEVRVRMVSAGVCHTDANVRIGLMPTPLPAVLGHEGAGVVESVGAGVRGVEPGDHVVLGAAYCGRCRRCRAGNMAYCENLLAEDFGGRRRGGGSALRNGDEVVSSHFFGQSSFATYANVVEESVIVVDRTLPLEMLGPLGCGIATGAGTVLNELRPSIGSSLAVIGVGAVGCAAIMAARVAGCTTIIAVDLVDARLELARELGATHVVHAGSEDLFARLMAVTAGLGVDSVVDTTARPEVLRVTAEALAVRGTLVLVGAARAGTAASFEIGASLVKGWTFKTVIEGSAVPQDFVPRLLSLWQQGRFPFDRLIRQYDLDHIESAFDDSRRGTVVKPVVVFSDGRGTDVIGGAP